ncbi:MAG: asparaginase [candidate division Zixibacteria bacterium]|nr:asparaginase [candidate division Zixibacteria bacterium]
MVYVYRGDTVESVHRGSAVICDSDGKIILNIGNPDFITFMRSTAKPFQVIPLIESGASRKFGFTSKEIALMAGSHSGESMHEDSVTGILDKLGLSDKDLKCGIHIPHYYKVKNLTPRPSDAFSPLQNNCSGKHAAMLALCKFKSWPTKNYLDYDHPCQKAILKAVASACHYPEEKIGRGYDGCGAPVFALPLRNMAWGMAQLLSPNTVPREIAKVYSSITLAMREHPEMVSGEGRFDYELSNASNGKVISKSGAEGTQAFGIPEKRYGGIVKIDDGATRAVWPATLEILHQAGYLEDESISKLRNLVSPEIIDHNEKVIGKIRCRFQIKRSEEN